MLKQELSSNYDLSPSQSEIHSNNNNNNNDEDNSQISNVSSLKNKKCFSIININNNNNNECSSSEEGMFSKVKKVTSYKTTHYNTKGLSYKTNSNPITKKNLTYGLIKRQTSVKGPNANRMVYVKSNTKYPLEHVLQAHQHDINDMIISSNLNAVHVDTTHNNNISNNKLTVTFKAKTGSSYGGGKNNVIKHISTVRHVHSNCSSSQGSKKLIHIQNNMLLTPQNIILDQVIYNTDKVYIRDIKGELFRNKKLCINAAGIVYKHKATTQQQQQHKPFRRDGVTYFSNNKNDEHVDYVLNYQHTQSTTNNKDTPSLRFKIELSQKNLKYYFKPIENNLHKEYTAFNEVDRIECDESIFYLKMKTKIIILNRKVQTMLGIDIFIFIPDIQSEIISITKFNRDRNKEWQRFYNRVEIIGKDESTRKHRYDDSEYDDYDDVNADGEIDYDNKHKNSMMMLSQEEEKKIYFDNEGLNREWFVGYDQTIQAWYLDVDGKDYSQMDDAWEACFNEVEIKKEIIIKNGKNMFKIYKKQRKK